MPQPAFEKILPIHVIVVNVLPPIPAAHHMMDRSRPSTVIDAASPPFPIIFLNLQSFENIPNYGLTPSTIFAQLLRNICGGAHRLKLCLGKMSDG